MQTHLGEEIALAVPMGDETALSEQIDTAVPGQLQGQFDILREQLVGEFAEIMTALIRENVAFQARNRHLNEILIRFHCAADAWQAEAVKLIRDLREETVTTAKATEILTIRGIMCSEQLVGLLGEFAATGIDCQPTGFESVFN